MNKKGFTVIELLASFTLTMIIMVFLFEIVLELKSVYVNSAIKEKILEKNALIATKLTKDFDNFGVKYVNCRENSCTIEGSSNVYTITILDNGVSFKEETFDDESKEGMIINMPEKATINSISAESYPILSDSNYNYTNDNSFIKISYKVKNKTLKKDIDFNYVYTFNQEF